MFGVGTNSFMGEVKLGPIKALMLVCIIIEVVTTSVGMAEVLGIEGIINYLNAVVTKVQESGVKVSSRMEIVFVFGSIITISEVVSVLGSFIIMGG